MEVSLSWLADYLDLTDRFEFERGAGGHHFLRERNDGGREALAQLGHRLTGVGLAVESLPVRAVRDAAGVSAQEWLLDVDVTSNRPDCLCHLGIARELALALAKPLRRPDIPFYGASPSDGANGSVVLEDQEGCPRYVARTIRGVRVGPSPEWLRRRLESIGQKSINNVVDATNFVMWELGQPLHAFDLAKVEGGEIRVRRARAGERLTTLDGKERALDPEVLVIADRRRPVGLAGIMGGLASEVTAETVDLLLESAHFDRRRVRLGAKGLNLHTDASHRFERGADPEVCDLASRRCAALIVAIAGGEVAGAVDAVAAPHRRVAWRLEKAALDRFVGADVPAAEIERILAGLELEPHAVGDGVWEGEIPGFRAVDFEPRGGTPERGGGRAYAQDIYEEVLRHWGLGRVRATLPRLPGIDAGANPAWDRRGRVQLFCRGLGFAEGVHYAFHDRAADARLPALVAGPPLALANPLSDRYAVMRRSLVPNLCDAAEFNLNRGATSVRLFEVGHLFPGDGGAEVEAIGMALAGGGAIPWDRQAPADLLELKGALEALLDELGSTVRAVAAELPGIVPGTGALLTVAGAAGPVGWLGCVAGRDGVPLFAGEILLDSLPPAPARRAVELPPRFPGIDVDTTLTHARTVTWREIGATIRDGRDERLHRWRLKDRYQGPGVPEGAVATTIAFEYLDRDRTLTLDEVTAAHAALAAALERRFGVARASAAAGDKETR